MAPFRLTRKAVSDLKNIARFTEKRWGRDQRNFYLQQLDHCFYQLVETPTIGVKCDYIRRGYRKFPQGSHVVFYRICVDECVEIVRVLHKQMDVAAKF